MSVLCCCQNNHPNDWFCEHLYTRERCSSNAVAHGEVIITPGGPVIGVVPDASDPEFKLAYSASAPPDSQALTTELRPATPHTQYPPTSYDASDGEPPKWLAELETAINEQPDGPTPQQLLTFAQGLKAEGFNPETLAVARYIEHHVPLCECFLHSQNYLIQAHVFDELGEPMAAKKSLEMATNLANGSLVRKDVNSALERILQPMVISATGVDTTPAAANPTTYNA